MSRLVAGEMRFGLCLDIYLSNIAALTHFTSICFFYIPLKAINSMLIPILNQILLSLRTRYYGLRSKPSNPNTEPKLAIWLLTGLVYLAPLEYIFRQEIYKKRLLRGTAGIIEAVYESRPRRYRTSVEGESRHETFDRVSTKRTKTSNS